MADRILVFGDSLTHRGANDAPSVVNVTEGSNRGSGSPGDLLVSKLLEANVVNAGRIDAKVGRSALSFFQIEPADQLISDDLAWQPSLVVIMLGTNDMDRDLAGGAGSMTRLKALLSSKGAEVWAVGPPWFPSASNNAKAAAAFAMMSSVFGDRLIDLRPLTMDMSGSYRTGDGIHFQPAGAQIVSSRLATALVGVRAPKQTWLGVLALMASVGMLGAVWLVGRRDRAEPAQLEGRRGPRGRNVEATALNYVNRYGKSARRHARENEDRTNDSETAGFWQRVELEIERIQTRRYLATQAEKK